MEWYITVIFQHDRPHNCWMDNFWYFRHKFTKRMKYRCFLLAITLAGCTGNEPQKAATADRDTVILQTEPVREKPAEKPVLPLPGATIYSNERFKEVRVERTAQHTFLVQGKGQIFEASFNWVVEDGHYELKKGFEMTDAGAPEWGNFRFTVDVQKERANSTLMLILFESSPKDGSRQFELPVVLY